MFSLCRNSDEANYIFLKVLKAVASLAYADGKPADVASGVYSHHIIMTQFGRKQLMMPIQPPACMFSNLGSFFGSGSKGNMGGIGGMMNAPAPNDAPKTAGGHSHTKRQGKGKGKGSTTKGATPKSSSGGLSSFFESLIPAVSVFVGGGGSAGSGSAFAAKGSDVKSGVYIGKSDTFQFSSEIVNYDPREKDIYISLDFEWVPGTIPGLLDVGMGALSAVDCASPTGQFVPPKDRAQIYKGSDWTITEDGYFVNFTPHLHDGGVNIKVYINGKLDNLFQV